MGAHIPGNPTLVPKNLEGAGSLRLANFLYRVAPQDGSAFGTIGRGIAFEQRGGKRKRASDVIEAAGGVVRREILGRVDIQRENVADSILIFSPVQAVQPGRRQIGYRMLVEFAFQPGDVRFKYRRFGAGHSGRRHHAGTEHPDDAFPLLGALFHMSYVEVVECDGKRGRLTGGFRFLVVADHTVLSDKGFFGDSRGSGHRGGSSGALCLRTGFLSPNQ